MQHGVESTAALLGGASRRLRGCGGGFDGFRHVRSFPRIRAVPASCRRLSGHCFPAVEAPHGGGGSDGADEVPTEFEERVAPGHVRDAVRLRGSELRGPTCLTRSERSTGYRDVVRTTRAPHRVRRRHGPRVSGGGSADPGAVAVDGEVVRGPARRGSGPAGAGRDRSAVGEREHRRAGAGDDGRDAVGAQRVDQRQRRRHRRRGGTPGAGSRGWPGSSCSGWPASAATSSAARPASAAASACGTVGRQQAAGDLGRDRRPAARTPPAETRGSTGDADGVAPAVLAPARSRSRRRSAGATLSGWPSRSAASASSASSSSSSRPAGAPAPGPARTPADDRGRRRAEAAACGIDVAAGAAAGPAAGRPSRRTPRASPGPRGASRRAGTSPRALAVDLDHAARRPAPRPRARRAGRGPGRASRSRGRGWPRSPAPRPAPGRRRTVIVAISASPAAAAAAVDVGVDDRVDQRAPKPSSAVAVSLSPWPVTVIDDRAAGVRLAAARASCEQPGDAGGRGRLDEDAVAGGELALGGEDLVVGDGREPAAGLVARGLGELPRGRVADPDRGGPGLRVGERLAGHQRRRALGLEAAHHGLLGGQAEVGVLRVAQPVRRDVAGVADRQQVVVGGVAEEVDDLERRGLLALEPDRVDRVDQRDRVVPGQPAWPSAGSRRSCRGP